nr:MAG TPA: hypothetical protein [Caudoviricetes sp.]
MFIKTQHQALTAMRHGLCARHTYQPKHKNYDTHAIYA